MGLSWEPHSLQQKKVSHSKRWKGWSGGVTWSDSHTACYFKNCLQGAGVTQKTKTLEQGKELGGVGSSKR